MGAPDFYLSSTEHCDFEQPRRRWRVKRLPTDWRDDDLLLVRIDPPLIGQEYGLGWRDIDLVILATRHRGATLFPIREWPIYVHVARPLIDSPELRERIEPDELELIAWAELNQNQIMLDRGIHNDVEN
jgi:hypothetical protein